MQIIRYICNSIAFSMRQMIIDMDFWGVFTSIACAIHCALFPLLISFGALNMNSWLNSPLVELVFISFTLIFVYFSIIRGYFQKQVSKLALITCLIGLSLIIGHHYFSSQIATIIVTSGGLLVASSHFINLIQKKVYSN